MNGVVSRSMTWKLAFKTAAAKTFALKRIPYMMVFMTLCLGVEYLLGFDSVQGPYTLGWLIDKVATAYFIVFMVDTLQIKYDKKVP